MMAKRCPQCGGKPKYVYYAVPQDVDPDGWEFGEYGLEPTILFKRLECKDCGATTVHLSITCDQAIQIWNDGHVLQYIGNEDVSDVEPEGNTENDK